MILILDYLLAANAKQKQVGRQFERGKCRAARMQTEGSFEEGRRGREAEKGENRSA